MIRRIDSYNRFLKFTPAKNRHRSGVLEFQTKYLKRVLEMIIEPNHEDSQEYSLKNKKRSKRK